MRIRLMTLAGAAALVVAGTAAAMTVPKVFVSDGPGFTIKGPKTLKAGKYSFVVNDQSSSHNWHLQGPGINKDLTSVPFSGKKSVTVALKKGTYTFYCVAHASSMKGSFKVG